MKSNNSLEFFKRLKLLTEKQWAQKAFDPMFDTFQRDTKWRPGLTEEALQAFEIEMGFTFPEPLRNFYRVMNGVDKPELFFDAVENITYPPWCLYSYPDHLGRIRELINLVFNDNRITADLAKARGVSRIFPIYGHRFIMIDKPGHPVLSMFGNDIIFWAKNLSDALLRDLSDRGYSRQSKEIAVSFWYPRWRRYPIVRKRTKGRVRYVRYPKMPKFTRETGRLTKLFFNIKKQAALRSMAMK